jgi:uncharacterized protein (TIGR02145 family)
MADNLNEGTRLPIANVLDLSYLTGSAIKVCYNDLYSNCSSHGALYQWAMAMDLSSTCNTSNCQDSIQTKHQGMCPTGWHIPTSLEFGELRDSARSFNSVAPGNALKSISPEPGDSLWNRVEFNDANSMGFRAIPSGIYNTGYNPPRWDMFAGGVYFWTTDRANTSPEYNATSASLNYGTKDFAIDSNWGDVKTMAFSVRCLQD